MTKQRERAYQVERRILLRQIETLGREKARLIETLDSTLVRLTPYCERSNEENAVWALDDCWRQFNSLVENRRG